jgi:uncharacterized membrane protein
MKNNLKLYYWISGVIIVICLFLVIIYPFFIGTSISKQSVEWSNFGEYVGGVIGPLFGLLAFIGVLLSIANQNKENKKDEKENKKQATENRIIKQIEFHHNICNNVNIPANLSGTKFKRGRPAFEFLFEKHLKAFYQDVENQNPQLNERQKTDIAFTKLYSKAGKQFGFYFRNLFYLIKYIDDSVDIDKEHFVRLVRAQLSTSEIQMLMYNCLFDKGAGFKNYVEQYGLLNGIDESEMIKENHKELFADSAFE